MIESELYSFLSSGVVLVIGADKKILDCSFAFLKEFSLAKVPAGTHFNKLFDTRGEDIFARHLALQPAECIWLETGRRIKAVLTGGCDGYRLMFESKGSQTPHNAEMNDHRFSMLINHMQEGMAFHQLVFKDGAPVDYIVEDINTGCEKILSLKRAHVAGRLASQLYKGKVPLLNDVADVVSSGKPRQFERYIPEFGKHFWLSITPWGENRFGIIFSDLTPNRHTQMLQNTLSVAANEMAGAYDTAKLFDAAASVLGQNGFECMLLLTGSDLAIHKTYLSVANAPRVYCEESCLVPSRTFLQAARLKSAIFIDDFQLNAETIEEAGRSGQLKGIAAPLIVSNSMFGVFVILAGELNKSETSVVKVFADLMAATIERSALIQSLKRHIDELTLSKQAHELTVQRLNMASAASSVGFWEYDFDSDMIYLDETAKKIFSWEDNSLSGTNRPWESLGRSGDLGVGDAFLQAADSQDGYTLEYRVVCADGAVKHVRKTGMVVKDETGNPIRMVGSIWDITERKHIEQALEASERQLNKIFDLLPVGLWVADKDGRIVKANPAGERIWEGKLTSTDTVTRIYRYPNGEEIAPVDWALSKTLRNGETVHEEMLEIETLGGSRRIIANCTAPVTDENGQLQAAIMINRDVTENEKAKAALKAEKELLSITLQSIGEGVVVTDKEGVITAVNQVFEQISGFARHEVQGLLFENVVKTRDKGENLRPSLIEKTLMTGKTVSHSRGVELMCRDPKTVSIAYTVSPIKDSNGQIIGTVSVMRDITVEEKKQKRIDYLVYHDALTGVYNRRYFEHVVKKIDTEQHLPLSVVNCDVNGLKLSNDAFGHNAGDKLLVRMAAVLQKACRTTDIVIRSGGDEFLILMPDADEIVAQKVCAEIKILSSKSSMAAIDCSISVGWATKKHPDESLKVILSKAEAFMYRNKSSESPKMRFSSINTILQTLHGEYARERLHCRHVSQICVDIARAMGLTEREVDEMSLVGRMHDIGKIAVNAKLFSKPDVLTDEEWVDMKRHPEVGFRILCASTEMAFIAKAVLAHHERFDGTGYPNGLKGSSIPMMARILAVADAYEAMTNERPYRRTKTSQQALDEISSLSGTQFDPEVADVFLKLSSRQN